MILLETFVHWLTNTLNGIVTLVISIFTAAALWWNLPFANKKWILTKFWWRHFNGNRKQLKLFMEGVEEMKLDKLNYVVKQLSPNGSESFFDKVLDGLEELKNDNNNTRELMNLAFWKSDKHGEVNYCSPALCDMWDCHGKDMMNKSWTGLVKDAFFVQRSWNDCVSNASSWTDIIELKNGLKVKPHVIHNKGKDGLLKNSIVSFDIVTT